ncbi:MAG TPA: amidohydrolase, partial [Gemmatales bacterium]|nr:amidohydrolase [Gemmatales bacterium]
MSDLEARLLAEIERIQFVDPHSHIQPRTPAARSLDDLLGYHYYTELAHSTGMGHEPLGPNFPPRERVRRLLAQSTHFRNTVQYSWLVAIARYFLGWTDTLGPEQSDALWDRAETLMAQPDWEKQLINRTGVEQIFLTNDFDDDLTGFDSRRYVPCLRTDELVFRGTEPRVRDRLAAVTGVEPIGLAGWRRAIAALFERFIRHGAAYCAVSLPPDFEPQPLPEAELDRLLQPDQPASRQRSVGVFWELARACAECGLPFALMIGVHRQVYRAGVYQGQDLFDQRTSLHAFAELFNAFPGVRFCVSVLSSPQNQELASY